MQKKTTIVRQLIDLVLRTLFVKDGINECIITPDGVDQRRHYVSSVMMFHKCLYNVLVSVMGNDLVLNTHNYTKTSLSPSISLDLQEKRSGS